MDIRNGFFIRLRFYYVIIAFLVNMIVFFWQLLAFAIDAENKKSHGNSVLLILLNIPVALLYLIIFIQL